MIDVTEIPQFAPESVSTTNDHEQMQRQKQITTTDTIDTL